MGNRIPVSGYVRQLTRRVVGPTGQELVTDTTVRLPIVIMHEGEPVRIVTGDQVELPAPFTGTWEVEQVDLLHGAGNPTPDHQKLTLKAAS